MPPAVAAPAPIAPIAVASPAAAEFAHENWQRNRQTIRASQPTLASSLDATTADVAEWLYGRDGSLTAMAAPDEWWTGCSVPHAAAAAMLAKLDVNGVVACFLEPAHAAPVRVALAKLRPQQAVIVVQPDVRELVRALHCEDFSGDIAAGRLWFIAGDAWTSALGALFDAHGGLPTPSSFVRLPTAEPDRIEQLVKAAQNVFAAAGRARAEAIQQSRRSWTRHRDRNPPRLGVVAPSTFDLWADAGAVLADVLSREAAGPCSRFDPDRPAAASPLALARFAQDLDAIVSADIARADAPRTLPDELPWVTWMTTRRIPSAVDAGPNDRLLLASDHWADDAVRAGWSGDRLGVAGWPELCDDPAAQGIGAEGVWIIEDTIEIAGDPSLDEFSSHRLLWEAIESELRRDPLATGDDVNAFLTARMRQLGVVEQAFDRDRFIERLILPARQQGIARLLIRAGMPVRLAGRGWSELQSFRPLAEGPVRSRVELSDRIRAARVIVRTTPADVPHPLDRCHKPVIAARGRDAKGLLNQLRAALGGEPTLASDPIPDTPPAVSARLVMDLLSRIA